jgi:ubiquinone/menaquinone biosynthesis C-methylase UbiE
MKQGDFTALAKNYIHRTGYADTVLRAILHYVGAFSTTSFCVADVGAGTGKLTENLISLGLKGFAIEPNAAMRAEGQRLTGNTSFVWSEGSGEMTHIPSSSVDLVMMASSFHWTDQPRALKEFHRILKPGGFFTALWNPRDLSKSLIHKKIEERIAQIVPGLKRVSSGSSSYTQDIENILVSTGHFQNVLFMEASHEVAMPPERYLGAWRSVNDIQAQAGPKKFEEILEAIQEEIADLSCVTVPYKTRAWTVQSKKV